MKHIDVYVWYKYGHKFIEDAKPYHISRMLGDVLDFPCTPEALEQYFHNEPKTNYVVNALHDKGIQAKTIAEWMNMNKSTVSYHLSNPIVKAYINPLLKQAFMDWDAKNEYE